MARKVRQTRQVKCSEPSLDDAIRAISKWYNDEIRGLVETAKEEIKRGNITDINDWIHETIDEHEFVIYTYKARLVLVATDNPDAFEDEMGSKPETVEQAAYGAMSYDLRERLSAEGVEL